MGEQAEEVKVDENAGIPKQVLKDAAEAEELHAKIFNPSDEEDSTVDADKVDTGAKPADKVEEKTGAAASDTPDEKTWEERYNELNETHTTLTASHSTLRGKFDKEVPALHQDLKDFKALVRDRLGDAPKKDEPVALTDTPEFQEKFKQFKEDYGDEFLPTIKEFIMADLNPLLADTIKPVADRIDTVAEDQTTAAKQKFSELVTGAVEGDWNALLTAEVPDEKFATFLETKDPSGLYTYGNLIAMASDKWDVDLFSKVFNLYFESVKPAVEEKKEADDKVEKKPATPAEKAKEAIVAPSRKNPKVELKEDDKIIWTTASMAQFEKDEREGKISKEDAKELWDDILLALGEGRITD